MGSNVLERSLHIAIYISNYYLFNASYISVDFVCHQLGHYIKQVLYKPDASPITVQQGT